MKMTHFRAMMNVENNDLIYKIQENTIKRSQKAKILQKLLKNSIERVFNFIVFIDENDIRLNPPRYY